MQRRGLGVPAASRALAKTFYLGMTDQFKGAICAEVIANKGASIPVLSTPFHILSYSILRNASPMPQPASLERCTSSPCTPLYPEC